MKNFIKGLALMLVVCSAVKAENITGTIDYTAGTYTGDLYVKVGHGAPDTWGTANLPVFSTQIVSGYSFPYNYDTGSISTGTDYNVVAWIDSTADGSYDSASEAGGMYSSAPVTVSAAAATSNIDFTLQDPSAPPAGITIDVDADGYDFSAATTAAWGSGADIMFSSGTFTAGVLELEVYNLDIYDAGTGWSDVNSVNTFDNTGSGSNHIEPLVDHYYTFKDDADKKIAIKINAVSATSVTFEYNYDYGYTYYDTGAGIPVSFESITVTSD
ncbi:MAG: hypothetical protein Q7J59_04480, partial [Elusimicrobiota bacterium]|nr:hypothetical protein [Elusimicrobiota bacterium]